MLLDIAEHGASEWQVVTNRGRRNCLHHKSDEIASGATR